MHPALATLASRAWMASTSSSTLFWGAMSTCAHTQHALRKPKSGMPSHGSTYCTLLTGHDVACKHIVGLQYRYGSDIAILLCSSIMEVA